METLVACASWVCCSIGMTVFNKFAIGSFPLQCLLVNAQMLVSALVMLFAWRTLHIGSWRDFFLWCRVVPFYSGVLLTSIMALKHAPMSLNIVFRNLAPFLSLAIERFFPNPLKVDRWLILSMLVMVAGAVIYSKDVSTKNLWGIFYIVLNNFFIIGDRLLQRLMLGKDQRPVDMSKTSVNLVNNTVGTLPLFVGAFFTSEYHRLPEAIVELDAMGWAWVALSCVAGVGISYTGIWAQSLITATSFLVLATANKFVVLLIELFAMRTKTMTPLQVAGAVLTIVGSVAYGKARERIEAQAKLEKKQEPEDEEKQPLLPKPAKPA